LLDVDLQCLTIFFKGAILKDEVEFGMFKEEDFRFETKFHVFIRTKLTKELIEKLPVPDDNKLEVAQN